LAHITQTVGGSIVRGVWDLAAKWGAIGPTSPRARRFGSFGEGTAICFPYGSHVNERHIHIGANTMVGPGAVLSAGWGPGHPNLPDVVVRIGDRCLIGRGSSVIGHRLIEIGDDVWTGYDVRIADMNHGYEDVTRPISGQWMPEDPIRIGDGSWLGHHVVVLPGVTIGKHVTVGAGSVVTDDLPDYSVAVGVPAKVVRIWTPEGSWERVTNG
jgi:acetyltransferase-like isoleucine patch superfamily enzyme